MQIYFRKTPETKVCFSTTKLLQKTNYIVYFFPDHLGQPVALFSKGSRIQLLILLEFFKIRIENIEWFDPKKDFIKVQKTKAKKKRKRSNQNFSEEKLCQGTEKGKKFCQYHGTCEHITNQCTTIKLNSRKLNRVKNEIAPRMS